MGRIDAVMEEVVGRAHRGLEQVDQVSVEVQAGFVFPAKCRRIAKGPREKVVDHEDQVAAMKRCSTARNTRRFLHSGESPIMNKFK